jgi:hypothetical protein
LQSHRIANHARRFGDAELAGAAVNWSAALLVIGALFLGNTWPAPGPGYSTITGGGGSFACNDGADNDADGVADFPADAGCSSPTDNDESGDNTIIVGANLTDAQLTACINGTDQGASGSICHARVGVKMVTSTVCGNATSTGLTSCNAPTLRRVSGASAGTLANTDYNYLDFSDGWRTMKIGGGGFITGFAISPDGKTRCVRTDTYGAYCWEPATARWLQVVSAISMPAADIAPGVSQGAYEVVVAPSLSTRIYMARSYMNADAIKRGYVFRSNDRGTTWTRTSFPLTPMDANDGLRFVTQKMAVSPTDPNVVLIGTASSGLYRTIDGGTIWTQIATVPTTGPVGGIAFGSTNTVWLTSGAAGSSGAYKSTDNGVTFALQAGGPNGVAGNAWGGVANGANYWVTYGTFASGAKKLWMNNAGAWTDCTPAAGGPTSPQGLAMNAAGTRIAIGEDQNAGAKTGVRLGPAVCSAGGWDTAFSSFSLVCPNAAWLCAAVNLSSVGFAKGALAFDPIVDRLWLTTGVSPWYTAASSVAPSVTWTEQTNGIEQLASNEVTIPSNGSDIPLVGTWDFGNRRITNPEVYQTTFTPGVKFDATWDMDWASSDPNFIVAATCWTGTTESASSIDGGANWVPFPSGGLATLPAGAADCDNTWGTGGTIAASTPTNWVWIPAGKFGVTVAGYYTTNAGTSWTKMVLPAPMTDDQDPNHGWPAVEGGKELKRKNLAADRVLANTFYLSIYQQGIYRSIDSGATWVRRAGYLGDGATPGTAFDSTGFNATLKAVPGKSGQLFFTGGQRGTDLTAGNPSASPLWRSVDGGQNWTKVPNVLEVYAFGFGKTIAAVNYPRILIVGWVNNVYGVWQSDDNAATWTQLGSTSYALNSIDQVRTIDGDKSGERAFIGYAGSGYAYYTPQCSDGIDNDSDGFIDFPADTGCSSATDNDETLITWGPLTFNASIFTGMSEHSGTTHLTNGASVDHQSYTGQGSPAAINCDGSCTMNVVRGQSTDDTLRITSGTVSITDSYLNGIFQGGAAHTDTVQMFGGITCNGSTYEEDLTRVTLEDTGADPAIQASWDPGQGTLRWDHVVLKSSGGQTGLVLYSICGGVVQHVYFNDVCCVGSFTDGSCFRFNSYNNPSGGQNVAPFGTFQVHEWNRVNQCTIVNGNIVVGAPIACSSVVSGGEGTCPP